MPAGTEAGMVTLNFGLPAAGMPGGGGGGLGAGLAFGSAGGLTSSALMAGWLKRSVSGSSTWAPGRGGGGRAGGGGGGAGGGAGGRRARGSSFIEPILMRQGAGVKEAAPVRQRRRGPDRRVAGTTLADAAVC